jgi:hypothetical protein
VGLLTSSGSVPGFQSSAWARGSGAFIRRSFGAQLLTCPRDRRLKGTSEFTREAPREQGTAGLNPRNGDIESGECRRANAHCTRIATVRAHTLDARDQLMPTVRRSNLLDARRSLIGRSIARVLGLVLCRGEALNQLAFGPAR